ncbi:PREDICTED: uncharacterized protein KIAA1958-like, partial [Acanthisitta chloris]|uniref:uncharacterized protein KIAA1958-like n=1 Tax=Acanthisitta chloris TaxID=57068 RepID=UPI0004F0D466
NESDGDGTCGGASALHTDLSRLVTWAHTHGTICNQIPAVEFMQTTGDPSRDSVVLWMCGVGHAYHWQCGKLQDGGRTGPKATERRRRLLAFEASAEEANFEEKRLRLTPSAFERGQADAASMGSCGRCPRVTQQNTWHNESPPRGSQNTREPTTYFSAAEQHLPGFGAGKQMKLKAEKILQSSDETANKDNQGDRVKQNIVSEPPAEKMAFHQLTASQRAGFPPTTRPPLTLTCFLQFPVSTQESLSSNLPRLGPFTATGPTDHTPRARNPSGSAAPRECFKPLPVPSTEVQAQLESHPSATFFEFEATADVQQQLQLSPLECGILGIGSSEKNMSEGNELLGSGQAPRPSASWSPEKHPPAASSRDVQKKKKHAISDIKIFKDWLLLHHPDETREVHVLPPADLDHYLVSFFNSTKKQDGTDFSASSFLFFQQSIKQYLKEHNYQYNVVSGLEFKASQEALKQKHQYLFQKEREEAWSIMENLTDEDVSNLLKEKILSKTHPQGFLHLMFTNIIRAFGASTHSQSQHLYWGQLVLRKSKVEYLEWKDDLSPAGDKVGQDQQLFAKPDDPEKCPVASYKEYAGRRPPDMLNATDPLYLTPKSLYSMWDQVWYCRKSLSRGKMEKMLKVIAQQVRGSLRKPKN